MSARAGLELLPERDVQTYPSRFPLQQLLEEVARLLWSWKLSRLSEAGRSGEGQLLCPL